MSLAKNFQSGEVANEITKRNQQHKQRLNKIKKGNGYYNEGKLNATHYGANHHQPVRKSMANREKELQIRRDNLRLGYKLQMQKSILDFKKMEEDFQEHKT